MLKDLPAAMRPREKLLAMGPAALADAELLALLLRTGLKGLGVLQMAEGMLHELGGIGGLLQAEPGRLKRIRGLGPAKRAELLAVTELARRGMHAQLRESPVFTSPQVVKDYLQMQIGPLPHEVFCVLFLDAQHRLLACEELFRGTLTQTSVYPREVVKQCLAHNAAAVVLAHNHPSGLSEPSLQDRAITERLKAALATVEVRVIDHFVIGEGEPVSLAARGWI